VAALGAPFSCRYILRFFGLSVFIFLMGVAHQLRLTVNAVSSAFAGKFNESAIPAHGLCFSLPPRADSLTV
jgi:hypothetical protein